MRIWALIPAMLLVSAVPSAASPWKKGGALGPFTWPAGTKVTIYIQPDPTGKGREKDARDGILPLNDVDVFKNKGISFAVEIGAKPADAQNAVGVTWQDGPPVAGEPNSNGKATPQLRNDPATGTTAAIGGNIILRSDKAPNGEILEDAQVGIVALHELLHLCGLAHETVDRTDIMWHAPVVGSLEKNTKAYAELDSIYNAKQARVEMNGSVNNISERDFFYSYQLKWLGGTELSLFDIQVSSMASVWSAEAPSGWGFGPLPLPSDLSLEPGAPGPLPNVVTFQLADSTSYLGADNPFLTFSFHSDQAPARQRIWLAGMGYALAPGPGVPEPGTWGMMLAGFGLIGCIARCRYSQPELTPAGRAVGDGGWSMRRLQRVCNPTVTRTR